MIYKYTKCESVIAKIMADMDMSEKNVRITDIREWIFEAIDKIGAPVQYIQKETEPIKICEGQVMIPDDLNSLTSVAYSRNGSNWMPVRKDESTFKNLNDKPFNPKYHHSPNVEHAEKIPTHMSQLLGINHSSMLSELINNKEINEPTYWLKPGWIVLNKKEGYVKLAYNAIATDERGYPLIPDLSSYQEAIYWYVVMKLSFPKFLRGGLGGKARFSQNTYFYIQQQWNFYRNQAYAESMMPNEDEMKSIKNEWTKLIPDWSADDNFFKETGSRQLNFNDYYYGY